MTFATNLPHAVQSRRRGFTLLELLLVIGIIGLLAGILLPAVSKTYARAIAMRTQADLQAISSAMDMYKADFGSYPPITSANSGAAVLGKALLGSYDAAHFDITSHALTNPPPAWSGTTTYQAGDVVQTTAMDYYSYATATNSAGAAAIPNVFVCIRNDTQADGASHSPTGIAMTDFWWSRFVPYDGQDGNGSRIRLAANPDAAGLPLSAAGKVYGPYLDPERFKTKGPTILDRYGSPILYFTVNNQANPALAGANPGWSNNLAYPPAANTQAVINLADNLGCFFNEGVTPAETAQPAGTRIRVMLGDFATDGIYRAAAAPDDGVLPQVPFLLWAAGPDKIFGPRGKGLNAGGSWSRGDVFMTITNPAENRQSAAACDDVTNFRQ